MVRRVKLQNESPLKRDSVSFIKSGFEKIRDPWMWGAWLKGVFFGAITVYLYFEGWPF